MDKPIKTGGRVAGVPNKKSKYPRSSYLNARITEGAEQVIKLLIEECNYKTPSDVLHDALKDLARNKLKSNKKNNYWLNRIQ